MKNLKRFGRNFLSIESYFENDRIKSGRFAISQITRIITPIETSNLIAFLNVSQRWGPAELTGRVIAVEIRPEGRRLILDQLSLPGLVPLRVPARIRIKLREG